MVYTCPYMVYTCPYIYIHGLRLKKLLVTTIIIFTRIHFQPYRKIQARSNKSILYSLFPENSCTCQRHSKPTRKNSGQCVKWHPYRNANQSSAIPVLNKKHAESKSLHVFLSWWWCHYLHAPPTPLYHTLSLILVTPSPYFGGVIFGQFLVVNITS